jgi:hypothetical protein
VSNDKKLHFMDIRIVFKKTKDDYEPDYKYFVPVHSTRLATNIPDDELDSVAESWAQVDHYQLLSPDVIINALSDPDTYTDLTR